MKDNIVLEPLEPMIAVPVRRLAAEPASPIMRVLAQVDEGGYRQRIVGRLSDLPPTLAWLEERGAERHQNLTKPPTPIRVGGFLAQTEPLGEAPVHPGLGPQPPVSWQDQWLPIGQLQPATGSL